MINLKCRNCAGEMSVDLKGELICPYCGSKVQLSDKELEDYKTMRLNMLHFLRAEADYSKDKEDGDLSIETENGDTYHGYYDEGILAIGISCRTDDSTVTEYYQYERID